MPRKDIWSVQKRLAKISNSSRIEYRTPLEQQQQKVSPLFDRTEQFTQQFPQSQ